MRKYWVSLLALLLLAGCQQAPQAFVAPVAEEVSNTAAFAVTVPEGKKVALYVEHWLDGEQVERKHLVSFAEDTKPVVVQVNEQDGQVEYLYVTQSGDVQETVEQVHLEEYSVQGMSLWGWLTPEEAAADGTDAVVLYAWCGDEETAVNTMRCSAFMEDAAYVEEFQEVQMVWAVLEDV